ncbi:MAG: hypothetical protein R3E97_01830 [Candidatus Eisenbacteria bacterium]
MDDEVGAPKSPMVRDHAQTALEVAALASSLVPVLGGVFGGLLSGFATDRKLKRLADLIEKLAAEIDSRAVVVDESYIRTEDFEDLFERTLQQATQERSEEKRRRYAAFLATDMANPGTVYERKLDFLRTLEVIQPIHLLVLRAIAAPPMADAGSFGTQLNTLRGRLPGSTEQQIVEAVGKLNDLRVTSLNSLRAMVTARGAADLRGGLTAYGEEFMEYVDGPQ